jgi:hypothetical protein
MRDHWDGSFVLQACGGRGCEELRCERDSEPAHDGCQFACPCSEGSLKLAPPSRDRDAAAPGEAVLDVGVESRNCGLFEDGPGRGMSKIHAMSRWG